MKQVQVFLASSIVEFEQERLELSDFCRKLGDTLRSVYGIRMELVKCENMDNCLELAGKQKSYDDAIRRSDLAVFLFGERAGAYTLGELDVAAETFGKRSSRIMVFCSEAFRSSEEPSLRELRSKWNEYQLSPVWFSHLDTVRLGILLRLVENGILTGGDS